MRNNRRVAVSELLSPTSDALDETSGAPMDVAIEQQSGEQAREQARGQSREQSNPAATRRQARARRRRRSPLAAGFVVVAAAATGSAAALLTAPDSSRTGAFPSVPPPPPSVQAAGRAAGTAGAGPTSAPDRDETWSASPSARLSGSGGLARRSSPRRSSAPVGSQARQIADIPDRPDAGQEWPALTYTLRAADGRSEPPAFPQVADGFTRASSRTTVVTISRGRFFTAVGRLPVRTASYEQCREQRFFVRWMAVDPDAVVSATLVDEPVRTVQNRPVHGSAGWMSSFGCVQPALRIAPETIGPNAARVIVETQVWQRD